MRSYFVPAALFTAVLAGCAPARMQLDTGTINQLRQFPVEVVYVVPASGISLPPNRPYKDPSAVLASLSLYGGGSFLVGAVAGGILGAWNGIPPAVYKHAEADLATGLKEAGRLDFTERMLAEETAAVRQSSWLGRAESHVVPAGNFDMGRLVKLTSSPVVIVLAGSVLISLDGSRVDTTITAIVYTRYKNGEITAYKEHKINIQTDSPIMPVSVYQRQKREWTELKHVRMSKYVANWFGNHGAVIRKAFWQAEPKAISDLRYYLHIGADTKGG